MDKVKQWSDDLKYKSAKFFRKARRKKCGVPKQIRYQTLHELALDMLKNNGHHLPHA